jgi:hypothetical protein
LLVISLILMIKNIRKSRRLEWKEYFQLSSCYWYL